MVWRIMEQDRTIKVEDEKHKPLGLERKWWVLVAVGVASFMSALDSSVANVILPILKGYYRTDVASVEWIVTIYLLVVSGLLLSFGRLGDLRGHKQIFILGFTIFILGSILCGISPSVGFMVLSRTLQALGAAMLFANSPAILTGNFPAAQRGQALGLQATMTYLGLTVGPSLGGWLAEQFSWRAVFFINVPVGLAALALSSHFIPADTELKSSEKFDIPGAVVFMAGLSALLLGLNQGHSWGWTSPAILGLLSLAIVLLGIFLIIETRSESPMLDLTLFRVRLFSAAAASALLNYISLYGIIFLMPFYLLQGRGFSPSHAGLILTAQPLVMAIAAPLSGTLSDRIGSRILSTVGMAIMAVGLVMLSRMGPATPTTYIIGSLAVFGLGTGVFISPNTNALMGSAPRNRQGIASGILATARNSGMVLGVGLAGAVFTTMVSINASAGPAGSLYPAISASFIFSACLACLGVVVSASRGN